MIKDCIRFKEFGVCEVDIKRARKQWTLLCRITKFKEGYTICELTPKGKVKTNIAISEKDAKDLIFYLGLKEIKSDIFRNASSFIIAWR